MGTGGRGGILMNVDLYQYRDFMGQKVRIFKNNVIFSGLLIRIRKNRLLIINDFGVTCEIRNPEEVKLI